MQCTYSKNVLSKNLSESTFKIHHAIFLFERHILDSTIPFTSGRNLYKILVYNLIEFRFTYMYMYIFSSFLNHLQTLQVLSHTCNLLCSYLAFEQILRLNCYYWL